LIVSFTCFLAGSADGGLKNHAEALQLLPEKTTRLGHLRHNTWGVIIVVGLACLTGQGGHCLRAAHTAVAADQQSDAHSGAPATTLPAAPEGSGCATGRELNRVGALSVQTSHAAERPSKACSTTP
jgi:hypothetical protein